MRWNKLAYALLALILYACWGDSDKSLTLSPPAPVTIRAIQALPHDALGALAQHDAAGTLPNGHLLIFDNGWRHTPPASRAVEYSLDVANKTATMVWQYSATPSIFNDFTGSAQRLENGNTVVAFTRKGIVDEVRADGTLLSRATLETAPGKIATPYRVDTYQELVLLRPTLVTID